MDQYFCCGLKDFLQVIGRTPTGLKLQKILKRSKGSQWWALLSEHRYLLEVPWDIPVAFTLPLDRSMALPYSFVDISDTSLCFRDPEYLYLDNWTTPWTLLSILRLGVVIHAECVWLLLQVIPWGIWFDTRQADEKWDLWETVVTSWNSSYSPMAPEMVPNADAQAAELSPVCPTLTRQRRDCQHKASYSLVFSVFSLARENSFAWSKFLLFCYQGAHLIGHAWVLPYKNC